MLPSPSSKLNSITCYATCLFCPLLFLANQLLTTFYYQTLQLRTGLDNHYRSRFLTLLLKLLVQLECQNWCHPKFNVMINRFSGILIRRKNHKSVKQKYQHIVFASKPPIMEITQPNPHLNERTQLVLLDIKETRKAHQIAQVRQKVTRHYIAQY